jgi:hypothetical protein
MFSGFKKGLSTVLLHELKFSVNMIAALIAKVKTIKGLMADATLCSFIS